MAPFRRLRFPDLMFAGTPKGAVQGPSKTMRRREFLSLLGAAAAWPIAARGQQPMPVIGFMSTRSPDESAHLVEAFRRGLSEDGFVEGQNIAIEFRWARGEYPRMP